MEDREDGGCHFRKWPVHCRNIEATSRWYQVFVPRSYRRRAYVLGFSHTVKYLRTKIAPDWNATRGPTLRIADSTSTLLSLCAIVSFLIILTLPIRSFSISYLFFFLRETKSLCETSLTIALESEIQTVYFENIVSPFFFVLKYRRVGAYIDWKNAN